MAWYKRRRGLRLALEARHARLFGGFLTDPATLAGLGRSGFFSKRQMNQTPSPKTPGREPWTRGQIVGLIVIAVFVFLIFRNKSDQDETSAAAKKARKDELYATVEGRIQFLAEETFKSGLKKVESSKITGGSQEGLYNVDVTFESLFNDKKLIEGEFRDAFERFFNSGHPIWEVWLRKDMKLVDRFGKESDELVFKVSMTKETAKKINWNNKRVLDFNGLWEAHFVHPVLLKE